MALHYARGTRVWLTVPGPKPNSTRGVEGHVIDFRDKCYIIRLADGSEVQRHYFQNVVPAVHPTEYEEYDA